MIETRASRWKPNAAIKASIFAHGIAGIGLVIEPSSVLLWLGILACNHSILTIGGLLPRAKLLGPNITHLPQAAVAKRQIALTFDDGPHPLVTAQILDILEHYQAKATFFCIGNLAEKHPDLIKRIVRQGHQVENHSYSHTSTFALKGLKGIAGEITRAQDVLFKITGRLPRFFRPIAGIRNPLLDPVISKHNVKLVSWSHRGFDTRFKDTHRVYHRLEKGITAGSILLLHDGNSARTDEGDVVSVACLPLLLQTISNAGLTTVTLDEAFQ